ncbi:MAG: DUF1674 domain-containing protein [Roseibium sp.]|uniref:DUF1674 domain-containing protein n=1 Tax=Roseibium sp. TaxID=1936156 RepID=UPI002626948F|nr:DUF1674 domain-containing protein [Roseibium sp.]MCV0429423.1 DUF1674 domain-containing protein [Roseibium sp.]
MSDRPEDVTRSFHQAEAPSLKKDIEEAPRKRFEDLPPAAQRALKEAEERRKEIDAKQKAMPEEVNGRGGLEPTRYEDWEIKGLTVDF